MDQWRCLGSRVVETMGLTVATRGLMLARSRGTPRADWSALFSGETSLLGDLKEVSLDNAIEESLLEGSLSVNARKNRSQKRDRS